MKRQLVVIAGPEAGRVFSLDDGQNLVIGRGQSSNTRINDPRMSRVHCQVQAEDCTLAEIAARLDKTPAAVAGLLKPGMRKLRELMGEQVRV